MSAFAFEDAVPVVPPTLVRSPGGRCVIDLRSPSEFAGDHLPGAVNVPLFDDAERAIVGTLYVRTSPDAAFAEGRARTAAKIERLVARIAEVAEWDVPAVDLAERVERMTAGGFEALDRGLALAERRALAPDAVVLYCWRGGLRSRSVISLLRGLGLERAVGVRGGYKAYRSDVRARLDAWVAPPTVVLRGLTGVGKTLVLRELERARPGITLDLEELAGHRSSILGMVGLEPCSQKTFESRLAARLERGFPGVCAVEGESRKVGDAIQPARVWEALDGGTGVELVASTERRVDVLLDDYLAAPANRAELCERLPFIEERLGGTWRGRLVALLAGGRERELVRVLLERYYDPLYRHSGAGRPAVRRLDASAPARAAAELLGWIDDPRSGLFASEEALDGGEEELRPLQPRHVAGRVPELEPRVGKDARPLARPLHEDGILETVQDQRRDA